MKIFVKAKSGAKEDKVVPPAQHLWQDDSEEYYTVYTKMPPVAGKANEGIARLLSEYFRVPVSRVRLIRGATSKKKVFEIEEE